MQSVRWGLNLRAQSSALYMQGVSRREGWEMTCLSSVLFTTKVHQSSFFFSAPAAFLGLPTRIRNPQRAPSRLSPHRACPMDVRVNISLNGVPARSPRSENWGAPHASGGPYLRVAFAVGSNG